jgi:anaerobic selenocysteine-containing dehydrogenase
MLAAHEGHVRAALLLGGNLFASNPDRAFAAEALRAIPCTLSLTTKLNEGHVHGRGRSALVVPVLARDEERETTTQESMFNFVRLSEGGQAPPAGEARSEVEVLASFAERILPAGGFDWSLLRDHRTLQRHIARSVPGYGAIGDIDSTRLEFQIEGRTFHAPRFATADGRARLRVTPLPRFAPGPGELRLTTLRSEGQFNTVVYEEQDLYRGGAGRDALLVAVEDAARLGLADGDAVLVETETGRMQARVTIAHIRPGSIAMYYPEANALVPRAIDPRSGTPAFKSVRARLRPHPGTGAAEAATD